jgi:gamma-glutamyltranspeptidase/glutathione hydrolase/leukotriene-C4 hydrolase
MSNYRNNKDDDDGEDEVIDLNNSNNNNDNNNRLKNIDNHLKSGKKIFARRQALMTNSPIHSNIQSNIPSNIELAKITSSDEFHSINIDDDDDDDDNNNNNLNSKIREYKFGYYNNIIRIFKGYSVTSPIKYGSFITFILCGLPLLITTIVLSVLLTNNNSSTIKYESTTNDNVNQFQSYMATSSIGAVATDTLDCSVIGTNILNLGGNAVDAAIASALCVGVLSPASSGIGGGCYILIHMNDTGDREFIDSREFAPAGATNSMFESDPIKAQNGGLAIAVIAELKGLYSAHERHGSGIISWSDLVMPASIIAEKSIISSELASYIIKSESELLSGNYTGLSDLYLNSNGELKVEGDIVERPIFANTLKLIAEHGPDYIYKTMASTLAQEIQDAGGIVTTNDILNYTINIQEPINTNVMGHVYVGSSGSSSGGAVVGGILKFVEGYLDPLVSQGGIYYHRLAEAMNHAFAIRISLGDPAFVNTTGPIDALLSENYMGELRGITSDTHCLSLIEYGGKYNYTHASIEDHGTTHLSVVDSKGNAVALTSTINTYFGSKVVSPSTGIIFNNQMDDFSIPNSANYFGLHPSPVNYPEPGKRPLSSMSPSLVLDSSGSKVRLIGGGSGGPRIITATVQVILNFIGLGMDLLSAVTEPRIHTQLFPQYVDVEDHYLVSGLKIQASSLVYKSLLNRYHNITHHNGSMGVSQFISIDPDSNLITAVSDPRKGGIPSGQ